MKKILALSLLASAFIAPSLPAFAETGFEAGDILVRGRLINVNPADRGGISTIGGHVTADDQYAPEVDFSYFLTPNVSLELIAATTKHKLAAKGTSLGDVQLGSSWALPPTLTLQYHFDTGTAFKPYVGAGVNYTIFHSTKKAAGIDGLDLDPSFGFALQAGVDYNLGNGWFLNADVKKVQMTTDATVRTLGTTVRSDVQLSPWVFGVGAGYKF